MYSDLQNWSTIVTNLFRKVINEDICGTIINIYLFLCYVLWSILCDMKVLSLIASFKLID